MTSWLYTILASPVLVAAVPLAQKVFAWWSSNRAHSAVEGAKKVYAALNDAQFRLHCDRILIVSAHNCGGPLRPDVLLYLDALYEVVADLEPRLERIVNVRIDSYMIDLMSKIMRDTVNWTKREEVPQGSYVRNLYETDGVNQACSFLIHTKDKEVIYGVCHFKTAHIPTPQEGDAVATLRSTLASLMK